MEKKQQNLSSSTISSIADLIEGLSKIFGGKNELQNKVMHYNPYTEELSVFDRADYGKAMSNNNFKDKVIIPLTSDALKKAKLSYKKFDYKYTMPNTYEDVFLNGNGIIVAVCSPKFGPILEIGTRFERFTGYHIGPKITRFVRDGENISVKYKICDSPEFSIFLKNMSKDVWKIAK